MRVVITGASSGIGEALARYYACADSILGLASRRPPPRDLPGTVAPYHLDVAEPAQVRTMAEDFIGRFGAPDLVIANAGLAATLAAFAPAMRRAGCGTLAGIASVAGFRGLAGNGAYSASKAAAIKWLESLRAELHGSGVTVVCVCPGYIDTPMTRVNRFPMPFLLPPEEAARRIARAIARRRRLAVIPWQMAAVSLLLRATPGWLYDRLAARAPRKPRDVPL